MAQLPPKPPTSGLPKRQHDRPYSPTRPTAMSMSRMSDTTRDRDRDRERDRFRDDTPHTFREGGSGRSPPRSRMAPRDRDSYVPRDGPPSDRDRDRSGRDYRGRYDDRDRWERDRDSYDRRDRGRDYYSGDRGRDRSWERDRDRYDGRSDRYRQRSPLPHRRPSRSPPRYSSRRSPPPRDWDSRDRRDRRISRSRSRSRGRRPDSNTDSRLPLSPSRKRRAQDQDRRSLERDDRSDAPRKRRRSQSRASNDRGLVASTSASRPQNSQQPEQGSSQKPSTASENTGGTRSQQDDKQNVQRTPVPTPRTEDHRNEAHKRDAGPPTTQTTHPPPAIHRPPERIVDRPSPPARVPSRVERPQLTEARAQSIEHAPSPSRLQPAVTHQGRSIPTGPRSSTTVQPPRMPVIPPYKPKPKNSDEIEIARCEQNRVAQTIENAKNIISVRKALHEYEVALLDLRAAEGRTRFARESTQMAADAPSGLDVDLRAYVATIGTLSTT